MITRGRAYFIALVLITHVSCTYSSQKASLKWDLKSPPIVFGEDVQLFCYGNTCQLNTIKKWIGGPTYTLLSFVGYSANDLKYKMMTNDTVADFGLMIRNITIEDTLYKYTCACGLQQYTDTLNLESVDYIYPPHLDFIISKGKNGNHQIEIHMDVYPLPTCNIKYEGRVTPVNIVNISNMYSYNGSKLLLYNISINHRMDVEQNDCQEQIDFTCNIGKRTYTTLIQKSDGLCKGKQHHISTYILVSIVVVFFMIIGLVRFIWFTYKAHIAQKTACCKQTGLDDCSPESVYLQE